MIEKLLNAGLGERWMSLGSWRMSQVLRKARAMADGSAVVWEAWTRSAFARRTVGLVCHFISYVECCRSVDYSR